jgi:hypothetical protein
MSAFSQEGESLGACRIFARAKYTVDLLWYRGSRAVHDYGFIAKRRAAKRQPLGDLPIAIKFPSDSKTFRAVARVELGSFVDFEFPRYPVGVHLVDIQMGRKKYSSADEPLR